jgi:hypothetical protein
MIDFFDVDCFYKIFFAMFMIKIVADLLVFGISLRNVCF